MRERSAGAPIASARESMFEKGRALLRGDLLRVLAVLRQGAARAEHLGLQVPQPPVRRRLRDPPMLPVPVIGVL
ncbi:hypothetical protein ACFVY0_40205 [Streptomyces sp. NPDC058286]|uniref:hypothetical protein n=1 Tax=Streptomyces sp. NPDC058286 TaxID=3346422 RepID=UPI0036E3492B